MSLLSREGSRAAPPPAPSAPRLPSLVNNHSASSSPPPSTRAPGARASLSAPRRPPLPTAEFLWRQGYVRCPDSCSADTPKEACVCSCPADIRRGRSASDLLAITGFNSLEIDISLENDELPSNGLTDDDLLDLLCEVGCCERTTDCGGGIRRTESREQTESQTTKPS